MTSDVDKKILTACRRFLRELDNERLGDAFHILRAMAAAQANEYAEPFDIASLSTFLQHAIMAPAARRQTLYHQAPLDRECGPQRLNITVDIYDPINADVSGRDFKWFLPWLEEERNVYVSGSHAHDVVGYIHALYAGDPARFREGHVFTGEDARFFMNRQAASYRRKPNSQLEGLRWYKTEPVRRLVEYVGGAEYETIDV